MICASRNTDKSAGGWGRNLLWGVGHFWTLLGNSGAMSFHDVPLLEKARAVATFLWDVALPVR
jgi:hypothetical protein